MSFFGRRWVADGVLWGLLVAPLLVADRLGFNEPGPWWRGAAGLVVLAVAVGVRRRWPLAAVLLAAGLGLTANASLFTLSYGPALAVLCLLLGLRGTPGGRPTAYALAAVGVLGATVILVRDRDPATEWFVLAGTLLFVAYVPWLAGRSWGQHRELAAAALARAEQLERERHIVTERAWLRERARIAQEMHDSLGHELSLVALRAAALQIAPDLPADRRQDAAELRTTAADATDRLREIIGLLEGGEDEPAPLAPAGESVEELVDRAATAGLRVRLGAGARDGRGDGGSGAPDTSRVGRTVHRVVQESLTNAAKYAPDAHVTVDLERTLDGVTVTVTDDGGTRAWTPVPPRPDGGSGLLGLRGQVTATGGSFEAGRHGDGFQVRARLPYGERSDGPRARGGAADGPAGPPAGPSAVAIGGEGQVADATRAWQVGRRRTYSAFAAAGAVGVVLVAGAFGWYAYSRSASALEPGAYDALHVGETQREVERLLPRREADDPPSERAPAAPDGADCRYYRAGGELFAAVEHFRLCFTDGRLVAKDVVPTADGRRTGERGT
ncbi:Nitrate/nitrite sensor protein NarX [Streptomyces sp. YIM 130001]|uniref:sensor histidine kinase n=1 Tax=Streptomyces sp. YIM 130001 TaxID=2259644 RepID=UPI000EE4F930|nr:sensor histidine kinase [Streptomyces sp. YIM 130001]RII12497.1 Nitrate/nitrite sensor protein NarX [Streptomyces sp. YIM 130001]